MKLLTYTPTEWDMLLQRCLASLDEQATESLEKSRASAQRKLAAQGLSEPPIDKEAVKRFLLLYAKLDKRQGKCIEESKIDKSMLLTAYVLWPESRIVRDYLADMRHKALEMDNEDRLANALDSLDTLNTKPDCKLNAKTVMFTVQSLDRKNFGDAKGSGPGGGRANITYILPGLTFNAIMSPAELEERRRKAALAACPVVDVPPSLVKEAVR